MPTINTPPAMVGTLALCPPGSYGGVSQEWNPLDFQNVVRSRTAPAKSSPIAVTKADLSDLYRNYIACLNKQDWPMLGQLVHHDVIHNGRRIGLSGYLEMLERDFDEIPDLHFNIRMLIADPPRIASRLNFDCTPKGSFLGLHVGGKRVSFTENVFYEFRNDKIREVWSVIDKVAIEAQL